MTDEARALLIVAALLSGASGSAGFVGGRMSVTVPPAEVRYIPIIHVPALAPPVEDVPVEPVPPVAPIAPSEPEQASVAPVEAKPLPAPRPKVDAKPKPQPKPAATKPRPVRKPTAGECGSLRLGLATIGRTGVNREAAARGYSNAQVAWALAACGL